MKSKALLFSRYFTYIKPVTQLPIIKSYGAAIFTLFVIAFFILYAIKPTVETILILQKKLDNSNLVLEKVNQKAKDLSSGKQNYEKMPPNVRLQIAAFIPDTINLKTIIQNLEQSSAFHQASISALQIKPVVLDTKVEEKLGTITAVDFTFDASGRYENLLSILQDLKSSARLISIEGLSLSNSEGSGITMSVTGKAYYIK